jgi:plastocyanin
MSRFLVAALAMLATATTGLAANDKPDKVVEITKKDGKLTFTEKGKEKPDAVVMVVGQTLRWLNLDDKSHRVVSVDEVGGKPLIDTGVIEPGKYQDVTFNNDLYRQAKGKTAGLVTIMFRSKGEPSSLGELQLLSPARR